MEVFLKDSLCGEQHAVHIGERDTLVHLKAKALDVVLGSPADALPEDVELSVDGEVLDDNTPLSGAAGVSQGCCIDVALSGARFVEVLQKQGRGDIDINAVPAWARRLRDVALAVVQCDGSALQHLDESFRSDRYIVSVAVRNQANVLQHASKDLREDEDVVLFFSIYSGIDFAIPAPLNNKPFVLTLVQRQGEALAHVDAALQADREVVMAAVQSTGSALKYACESLRNDRQVVMAAIGGIKHASAALRNDKELVLRALRMGCMPCGIESALWADREVMLTAVRLFGANFESASSALRHDRDFQREAILWQGTTFDSIPKPAQPCFDVPLHQDRDLILAAAETTPSALIHAHPSLQCDREVVLAAMHSKSWGHTSALRCVPSQLKHDEEVVLAGVRQDPAVLREAGTSLRANRDFVLQCVKLQGRALRYAPPSVASDRDVQLAAVAQDPSTLRLCDESIRSNRDVVLSAVRKDGYALKYSSDNLRKDREVVLAAVKSSEYALESADVAFCSDEEVVLAAAHTDGDALQFADPSLLSNRDFMLTVVRKCGCALLHASASLCRDTELQLAAILQDGRALQGADHSLRSDRSVVLQAVRSHGDALQFADPVFCGDEEVLLAAVMSCGRALRFAHDTLWNKREVVLAAVHQEGRALQYAPTALCCDKEVVLAAVRANPIAFGYASAPLRRDSDVVAAAFPEPHEHKRQSIVRTRDYGGPPVQTRRSRWQWCE